MNRPALLFLIAVCVLFPAAARAQESPALDSYVPPPMFGPAPEAAEQKNDDTTSDDVISFPIETKTKSNAINPGDGASATAPAPTVSSVGAPGTISAPPAEQVKAAPAASALEASSLPEKKKRRATPPVPPQRPSVLQASDEFIAQQKAEQERAAREKEEAAAQAEAEKAAREEAAAKEAAQKAAQEKAEAEAKIAAEKAEKEARAKEEADRIRPESKKDATLSVGQLGEQEGAEAPSKPAAAVPSPTSAAPPGPTSLPAPPKPAAIANPTLMGQELATPTVQQIYENLEEGHPVPGSNYKTALPQGPADPSERIISVRPNDPSRAVRIYAKRAAKKKETAHSFFLAFEPGQTEITETGENNLEKKILPLLQESPDLFLQVQAYAKGEGKHDPQAISLARAQAIRTFFLEKNIAPERIQTHALGATAASGPQDRVDLLLQREAPPKPKAVHKEPETQTSGQSVQPGVMGPPAPPPKKP